MTTQQSPQGPSQPIDLGLCSIFDYEELQESTKFFNPSEVVGEGGFGVVYRGKLRDGRDVAVKDLTVLRKTRVEKFFNEVRLISRLHHKNLVALYGCTNPDDKKMLLVYEFVPNGTVEEHLHHRRFSKKTFTWSRRLRVAIQTAEALDYLHSQHPPIIHRDIKSDNILLDKSFNAKVADFGLCRLLPPSRAHISTKPRGTQGYLDPEYNQLYKLTTKSDVYSFGVVLMELISGKAVLDVDRDDDEVWLVRLALNKMKNDQLGQLVDPELGYLDDPKIFSTINSMAQLASECLRPSGSKRPPMMEVIKSLARIKKSFKSLTGVSDDWAMEALKSLRRINADRVMEAPMEVFKSVLMKNDIGVTVTLESIRMLYLDREIRRENNRKKKSEGKRIKENLEKAISALKSLKERKGDEKKMLVGGRLELSNRKI